MIRDRIVDFRRVRAGDLLANPGNWRTHPEQQRSALQAILRDVGYVDALIARQLPSGELELVDGHLRRETTPEQEVPVLIVDLDDEETAKVLATFDPLAGLAEPDQDQLERLVSEVEFADGSLRELVDQVLELAEVSLADGKQEVQQLEEDAEPEATAEPRVKQGDVWQLGRHRLICGDCRRAEDFERLLDRTVQLAFTSPPYAQQREYDKDSGFNRIKPDEYVEWWEPVQSHVRAHLAADGSFFVNLKPAVEGGQRQLYVFDLVLAMARRWGWLFVDEFCWERSGLPGVYNRRFKNQFEPIYQFSQSADWKCYPGRVMQQTHRQFNANGSPNLGSVQGAGDYVSGGAELKSGLAYPGNRLPPFFSGRSDHPASFPVGLPGWFIQAFTDQGDAVLDPFLGSGSTILAAEQLDRVGYGVELSPKYCDIALARWEQRTGKQAELVE